MKKTKKTLFNCNYMQLSKIIDFNREVCFIDIEAISGKPHRIIQLSAIKISNSKVYQFNQWSNPEVYIPHAITSMLGKRDNEIKDWPKNKVVIVNFLKFLKQAQIVCFGSLDVEILRQNIEPSILKKLTIINVQYKFFKQFTNYKVDCSLKGLAMACEIEIVQNTIHNALEDAIALKKIVYHFKDLSFPRTEQLIFKSLLRPNKNNYKDIKNIGMPRHEFSFNYERYGYIYLNVQSNNKGPFEYVEVEIIRIDHNKKILREIKIGYNLKNKEYQSFEAMEDFLEKLDNELFAYFDNNLIFIESGLKKIEKLYYFLNKELPVFHYLSLIKMRNIYIAKKIDVSNKLAFLEMHKDIDKLVCQCKCCGWY